jgi:hypothetical protein
MLGVNTYKISGILNELKNWNIDILVTTETKKKGIRTEEVRDCIFIYSGVDIGKRAASDVGIILRKALKLRTTGYFWINDRIVTVKIKIGSSHFYITSLCAAVKEEFCMQLQEIVNYEQRRGNLVSLLRLSGCSHISMASFNEKSI